MPQYILNITRLKEYENVKGIGRNASKPAESSTIGKVVLYDNDRKDEVLFHCFCCENGGESTDTPKRDKRIIARKYKLKWRWSGKNSTLGKNYPQYRNKDGRNKTAWLYTDGLKNFENRVILIHIGQCPQDTEGCLLFGKVDNKNGTLSQSTQAILEWTRLAEKIGIENITLNINEIQKGED